MLKKWLRNKNLSYWLLFAIVFLIFILFLSKDGHNGDMGHWKRWTGFILMEGLPYIYDYGTVYPSNFSCNYPPVIFYIFKIYGLIFQDMENIMLLYKYFKIAPLLFDFLSAAMIFLLVKRTSKTQWLPLLLLLSPAFLYNSYIWGQIDSILTGLVALSLIFALRKSWILSIIFYIIALNTKMQAVVFLPVFLLALFPLITSWKRFGASILLISLTQLILLLPFIIYGTIGDWYAIMTSLVDQYTNVSLNAYNIWHLILGEQNPLYVKDYKTFWLGMTYKNWGLLSFCVFSFFALLPLLFQSIRQFIAQQEFNRQYKSLLFLSATLCVLGFFFFNTQMHERYSHPAMLMAFLYGVLSRNYWLYGLISVAYFLNMERTLKYFKLDYGTFVFLKPFIATLFLIALLIGIWQLYRKFSPVKDWKFIISFLKSKRLN